MSCLGSSPPPLGADPVFWFARLERAVRERDYLIANEARKKLAQLGWHIRCTPNGGSRQHPQDALHEAAGREGGR